MDVTTRWWWVRHAPVVNPQGRIYGHTDLVADLSDDGRLRRLARRLPGRAVWIATTLSRARETAAKLSRLNGSAGPVENDDTLREQFFGDWEGRGWDHIAVDERDAYWADPVANPAPNGESFADVFDRVCRAIARLNAAHAGGDVVVVAHAGPIRAALAHAIGGGPAVGLCFRLDPLSLTRLDAIHRDDATWWRVVAVNLHGDGS